MNVSPRLSFYASSTLTRQQAESARADRAYWAGIDKLAAQKAEEAKTQEVSNDLGS